MSNKLAAKFYLKKHNFLFDLGIKHKLIGFYSDALLEKLREVYYGGIPASIILLTPRICRGYCYDRALLVACALEDMDYVYVQADIDGIRYNANTMQEVEAAKKDGVAINPHYANHGFIEVKNGNMTWVIDTTSGLIYERHLYYLINRPKITKICSKKETMSYIEYQDIKNADLERDKYASHLLLPYYESNLDNSPQKERLQNEIALYKKKIDYERICSEINEDKVRKGIIP